MELNKKKLLIFTDWYFPAYKAGGPITSILNIVNSLSDQLDIDIVTSAYDLNERVILSEVIADQWITSGGVRVHYLTHSNLSFQKIKTLISSESYDAIYLNSLFSLHFTLFPILITKFKGISSKVILAPRGMLGQGALAIKSKKKYAYLFLAKLFKIYHGIIWHATAQEEKNEIIKHFGNQAVIYVIPNISKDSTRTFHEIVTHKLKGDSRRFLFCSRISKKKNLLFVLKLFSKIKVPFSLSIVGPIEDNDYYNECISFIKENNMLNIYFLGEKKQDELAQIYIEHEFFILPTQHENYGHVIIDAFKHACPVILSDQTPWRNLNSENCGWDIDLKDEQTFLDVIQLCIQMNDNEYIEKSKNAYLFAKKSLQTELITKDYVTLFSSSI